MILVRSATCIFIKELRIIIAYSMLRLGLQLLKEGVMAWRDVLTEMCIRRISYQEEDARKTGNALPRDVEKVDVLETQRVVPMIEIAPLSINVWTNSYHTRQEI